jgi:hypothetical protein
MKFVLIALMFALSLTVLSSGAEQISRLPNGDNYITNKVVVTLKYNTPVYAGITSIDTFCRAIGVTAIEPFYGGKLKTAALRREISRIYIFTLRDGLDAQSILEQLRQDPYIELAELYVLPKLCYTPRDSLFADQWYLTHIHADDCWNTVRGDTTWHSIIGIVDTGVYWDHPDLTANIWVNPGEDINHNGIYDPGDINDIDDDGNGYVDDIVGWDLGSNDNDPAEDTPTHGTHLAGCVSEVTDNGIGGAGMGFSARLMCVKASNSAGQLLYAYQGLTYAVDNGARILNCSWGSATHSQYQQNMINFFFEEGGLLVAGAGNLGSPDTLYPAGYEHVLSVTATDQNDHLAPFSQYGDWIHVAAPGSGILSTWDHDSYSILDGASMATAITAGLVGLIRAWLPSYNPDQVDSLIRLTADSIGYLNPIWPNAIRINAINWLTYVGLDEKPLPTLFSFSQNYPNPFNAQTTIRYDLPPGEKAGLTIYDIAGRQIQRLDISSDNHEIIWDGANLSGQPVSSGIYFYTLDGHPESARKMVLLK